MFSQDKIGCEQSPETLIRKKNCWSNFKYLEIHRCQEGAKIWFKQLIVEFGDFNVPFCIKNEKI